MMATIESGMIINDVIKTYPATIKVFNEFRVGACCGGTESIEMTVRRDGVNVETLLRALHVAIAGA